MGGDWGFNLMHLIYVRVKQMLHTIQAGLKELWLELICLVSEHKTVYNFLVIGASLIMSII